MTTSTKSWKQYTCRISTPNGTVVDAIVAPNVTAARFFFQVNYGTTRGFKVLAAE